ncbi:hypothetical protein LPH56_04220 [Xylella taiwanensis]|nr:hypothetical protein [Xylella taiwanensis]MCD8455339.1 hypothetical protein [Xylella taiwanensis]MCD8457744.1 hypothetical protein [Xylella taiwanensis]UFN42185.1 hypothetical protein LPH57_05135 [Xylella taiwanensis]UFS50336.1 hypothetical protein LPH54_04210 [Xylella taiwanensis]UFS52621.1 hypothetical protein LPH56_04220 [Xylella taiwanensis]
MLKFPTQVPTETCAANNPQTAPYPYGRATDWSTVQAVLVDATLSRTLWRAWRIPCSAECVTTINAPVTRPLEHRSKSTSMPMEVAEQ